LPHTYAVVTAEQMRDLERAAANAGISEARLQARAAQEIAAVVDDLLGTAAERSLVALVGPGNNGRDAMLAAGALARQGRRVALYLGPRHAVSEEELQQLVAIGVRLRAYATEQLTLLQEWLDTADVVLDGLLGIGVQGAMRSPLAEIAHALNAARAAGNGRLRVISVDLPSGLDSDTGSAPGAVVQADITVALGAVKAGTLRQPGAHLAGRIEPRPIGLPEGAGEDLPVRVLNWDVARALLPPRPLDAHKGSFGTLGIIGGSRHYVGAPILAALAAARCGLGVAALAVPDRVQLAAASRLPEATYAVLPGDGAESHPDDSIRVLGDAWTRFDAAVLGPGIGRSQGAEALVRSVIGAPWVERTPIVVDADALTLLSRWPEWWQHARAALVLTPHAGEMARLTGRSVAEVLHANWDLAREASARWKQVVVLKGAFTAVAQADGRAWVSPWPNPALATAGSGDVLAGLIGGFIAQGLHPAHASLLAVAVQARAAAAIVSRGNRTLLASDVAEEVPSVLGWLAS
jgi:NAD(P)H-hydrate epimerase